MPARIALQVASQIDSRTILDQGGAEKLLGAGDMLYLSARHGQAGAPPERVHQRERSKESVATLSPSTTRPELPVDMVPRKRAATAWASLGVTATAAALAMKKILTTTCIEQRAQAVIEAGKASTSYFQRKLRIGYSRAARLMDVLEERGVIGPADGAKPREVLEKACGARVGTELKHDEPMTRAMLIAHCASICYRRLRAF